MDSVSSVLRRAKALIDTPLKWCRGNYHYKYYDPATQVVHEKFCMAGAIREVSRDLFQPLAITHLGRTLNSGNNGGTIPHFNDDPYTTHADVMRQMDRAIETAEQMEREAALPLPEPIPAMIPAPTVKEHA